MTRAPFEGIGWAEQTNLRPLEGRGDVHRDLLAQRLEHVGTSFRFQRDKHADLAEARRGGVVHVGHDEARRDRDGLHAADLLVLADGGDRLLDDLAHSLAANGLHTTALCYNGVVHAFLSDLTHAEETVKQLARPYEENIFSAGGDWHSRHLTHIPSLNVETEWLNYLKPALE